MDIQARLYCYKDIREYEKSRKKTKFKDIAIEFSETEFYAHCKLNLLEKLGRLCVERDIKFKRIEVSDMCGLIIFDSYDKILLTDSTANIGTIKAVIELLSSGIGEAFSGIVTVNTASTKHAK